MYDVEGLPPSNMRGAKAIFNNNFQDDHGFKELKYLMYMLYAII